MTHAAAPAIAICQSSALHHGGRAVAFDVVYAGQNCQAFAIRYQEGVHAYLNRCTHVAMEMDYQPGRFFDDTGSWLLCTTHGAAYVPDTGVCAGGPCRGGLVKLALTENDGLVYWHPDSRIQPVDF